MLDRTGRADADVKLWRYGLARKPHLVRVREPAAVDDVAGGAEGGAEGVGKFFDDAEVFLLSHAASGDDDYLGVLLSDPYRRGELQVIGRNETALQASWQATPLLTTDLLTMWNMNDGSFLLSPAASYSLSNEAYIRGGFFFGIGAGKGSTWLPIGGEGPALTLPGSEYGIVPSSLYISLTAFF